MIDLIAWMQSNKRVEEVPLFALDENGVVMIKFSGKSEKPILRRHPLMEDAVINLVETNLEWENWEGLLYIMVWKRDGMTIPLYVGKAEKKGVRNELSANIERIATNKGKFARWGDGLDYHIGDSSHAVFEFSAYRKPRPKYRKWAKTLFKDSEQIIQGSSGEDIHLVRLKYPVNLILIPWFEGDQGPSTLPGSLPAVEKEVISLASEQFSQYLLNKDGI